MSSADGSFSTRVNRVIQKAIDPDELVNYHGRVMAIKDVPSPTARTMLGYGHEQYDLLKRNRIPAPVPYNWHYLPEHCLVVRQTEGIWVDLVHLVCAGCGLELTS